MCRCLMLLWKHVSTPCSLSESPLAGAFGSSMLSTLSTTVPGTFKHSEVLDEDDMDLESDENSLE